VCWRNHQEEIVINKYHRFWGPVTRVVRSVPSDSQFALVQWVDGKYTQLRLYYQNDANLVCEQCSDDGGDNWWSGYKWGATRKVVLQLPHYARFFKDEQNLPQHELSLPSPEGKDGRYLWVSNQHSGTLSQFNMPIVRLMVWRQVLDGETSSGLCKSRL
jgi:hypothetical protein